VRYLSRNTNSLFTDLALRANWVYSELKLRERYLTFLPILSSFEVRGVRGRHSPDIMEMDNIHERALYDLFSLVSFYKKHIMRKSPRMSSGMIKQVKKMYIPIRNLYELVSAEVSDQQQMEIDNGHNITSDLRTTCYIKLSEAARYLATLEVVDNTIYGIITRLMRLKFEYESEKDYMDIDGDALKPDMAIRSINLYPLFVRELGEAQRRNLTGPRN